ncbi:unnamed protein product [Lampetra fluviatilis]
MGGGNTWGRHARLAGPRSDEQTMSGAGGEEMGDAMMRSGHEAMGVMGRNPITAERDALVTRGDPHALHSGDHVISGARTAG